MQDNVKLFIKSCVEVIQPKGPIYEFGSLQVPGQENYADLRQYFPGLEYVGCDMRPGSGVDRVENLEEGTTLKDDSVPVILCCETIEHIFDIFKAFKEIRRIIKNDEGILIVSSLFNFGIHSHPFDYWRFTPECFFRLLSDFNVILVMAQGDSSSPRSIFGIGINTKNLKNWQDVLCVLVEKFEMEVEKTMGYGNSPWRKFTLSFYRVFQKKKYNKKIAKTKITWSIRENF